MTACDDVVVDVSEMQQLWHDLRQQLAAGLLVVDLPGDDTVSDTMRHRMTTLNQVLRSMMDLLAERPPLELVAHDDALDVAALVEECASVIAIAHGVPIRTSVVSPGGTGYANRVMLRRAVANVLDNASRAAGKRGCVRVSVGPQGRHTCIEVVDDGRGFGTIPSGTGHGLGIVGQAMRDCGGRLEISSGPGPGTTVRLYVPADGEQDTTCA